MKTQQPLQGRESGVDNKLKKGGRVLIQDSFADSSASSSKMSSSGPSSSGLGPR